MKLLAIMIFLAILLHGCAGKEERVGGLVLRTEVVEQGLTMNNAGGHATAGCDEGEVLLGGGCSCEAGTLYRSGFNVEDNTGRTVWECGCNPIPNRPELGPQSTTAQARCASEAR